MWKSEWITRSTYLRSFASLDRSSSLANLTTLATCNHIVHTRLMITHSGYLHRCNAAFSIVPFCCSWWFFACCRLIQECWDPTPSVRPTFAEIIVRLNKIQASCTKQGRWRDTFKLPWYISGWSYHMSSISCQSPSPIPLWSVTRFLQLLLHSDAFSRTWT